MNFLGMGTIEVLVILLLAFIFLGPERMVEVGRTLGKTIRQLRRFSTDISETIMDEDALGLLERPIVHQRGGRGHFETEDYPQPGSQTDSKGTAEEKPDEPVGFKSASQTPDQAEPADSPGESARESPGASPSASLGASPGASKEEERT